MAYTGVKKREYQLEWMRKRRQDWIDSQGGCCKNCGSTDSLEVDHIDPTTKLMRPALIWSRKQEVRDEELAKCQVLCSECHQKKTFTDMNYGVVPHGTHSGYSRHGCRCDECTQAHKEYNLAWRTS